MPPSNSLRISLLEHDETALLDYRDKFFNYDNVLRCRTMERMATALYYATLNRQWNELDTDISVDSRGYHLRDTRVTERTPTPVTNYVDRAVETEFSALSNTTLTANVIASSRDPRIEAAARAAREILEACLKKNNWPDIREDSTFQCILFGLTCIRTYWDESYVEANQKPSPEAVGCASCGIKLKSPIIDSELGRTVEAEDLGDGNAVLHNCPACGDVLAPTELSPEEASGSDLFGRSMMVDTPTAEARMDVVSPFELFFENGGIIPNLRNPRVVGRAWVEDIEYVLDRYPELEGELEPEDPQELMKYHPVLGEWDILGRYSSTMDQDVYSHHLRLYEVIAQPTAKMRDGRHILIANNKPVFDRELFTSENSVRVAKVQYHFARYRNRHGEGWGKSLVDNQISPQNRLNGLDAQTIDARLRMGSPHILLTEGMALEGPEWDDQYGGMIIRYSLDPLNPQAVPIIFGDKLIDSAIYQERDRTIGDMKALAGPQSSDVGEAPKNITTTSGLQILGEQADKVRKPRERVLTQMFEPAWKHILEMEWGLRTEQAEYEVETEDGLDIRMYDRMKIEGQTRVKIEKQAEVDKSLYQREAAREAQVDQLYRLDSQQAIKRLLELRGLPTDVNEDLNYQVDNARRQWIDFVEYNEIPVIDESIDDPRIHYQALATLLQSEKGQQQERAMGWKKIVPLISGWRREFDQMEALQMQVEQTYGTQDPQENSEHYARLMAAYQKQQATFDTSSQQAGAMAAVEGQVPAPIAPPMKPVPPVWLPPDKPTRIYIVWKKRLGGQPPMMANPGSAPQMQAPQEFMAKQDAFLRFRAVVDAYKLLADTRDQMMAQQAAMAQAEPPGPPAAPGTPEGNPGTGGATPGLQPQPTQ